jgi:hypothetical protein
VAASDAWCLDCIAMRVTETKLLAECLTNANQQVNVIINKRLMDVVPDDHLASLSFLMVRCGR